MKRGKPAKKRARTAPLQADSPLEDREYSVIRAVMEDPRLTQREISRRAGFSLGMTNLLLVRLAHKGLIKIRQIDWKRSEYLLTPRGAMEISRLSYAFVVHTFRLFQNIIDRVHSTARREYDAGLRRFRIVAWPLTRAPLIKAFEDLRYPDLTLEFLETFKEMGDAPGTFFIATEEAAPPPAPGQRFVQLLDVNDIKFRLPQ